MNKEFIPYEQALALKELGFDEPCFGLYHSDRTFYPTQCKSHEEFYGQACSAPLYQQAFKFLREKFNLEYQIYKSPNGNYYVTIHENTEEYLNRISLLRHACLEEIVDLYSYEKAEFACLKKLIEIVKINKNMTLLEKHKESIGNVWMEFVDECENNPDIEDMDVSKAAQLSTNITLEYMKDFADWIAENYAPNGRKGCWDSNELNSKRESKYLFDKTEHLVDIFLEEKKNQNI